MGCVVNDGFAPNLRIPWIPGNGRIGDPCPAIKSLCCRGLHLLVDRVSQFMDCDGTRDSKKLDTNTTMPQKVFKLCWGFGHCSVLVIVLGFFLLSFMLFHHRVVGIDISNRCDDIQETQHPLKCHCKGRMMIHRRMEWGSLLSAKPCHIGSWTLKP